MSRRQMGYLFLIPTMTIFFAFAIYPVFRTIYLSFFEYRLQFGNLKKFIGLTNYMKMFSSERFYLSLRFTMLFTFLTVSIEVFLGLIFAQFMNKNYPGKSLLRVVVLIPWAIPTIVSGFIWRFMVDDIYGVVNGILLSLGIIKEFIPWLSQTGSATVVLLVADIWKTTPYVSLLVLAGLQNIPRSFLEAAEIDGANGLKTYLYITFPLLKPVLATATLFRLIQSFKVYAIVVALTNGGPANTTEPLTLFTLRTYFDAGNYGYGAALASFTFIITVVIALLFLNIILKKVDI
ncbi:MAG: sugar ABC transporter permease [Spirochaetes bacterium]|nr:MAG: sugar ABC transporter permease [Spirochaetota bacterium]